MLACPLAAVQALAHEHGNGVYLGLETLIRDATERIDLLDRTRRRVGVVGARVSEDDQQRPLLHVRERRAPGRRGSGPGTPRRPWRGPVPEADDHGETAGPGRA